MGKDIADSLILVINKYSELWKEHHDEAIKEVYNFIVERLGKKEIPLIVGDFKTNSEIPILIKNSLNDVSPYNE